MMELMLRALGLVKLGREIAMEVVTMIGEQEGKERIDLSEATAALDTEIANGRKLLATLRARQAGDGGS